MLKLTNPAGNDRVFCCPREAKVIFRGLLKGSRKKEAKANLKVIRGLLQRYGS